LCEIELLGRIFRVGYFRRVSSEISEAVEERHISPSEQEYS
jgi:hypothetical protein